MRKYLNPEIIIKMLDFEDVTTESGVAAVDVAMAAMEGDATLEVDKILVME